MAEPRINCDTLRSTSTQTSASANAKTIIEERFGKYRLVRVHDGKRLAIGNIASELLLAGLPVEQFSPVTPPLEIQFDRTANAIPTKETFNNASRLFQSILKKPNQEPAK